MKLAERIASDIDSGKSYVQILKEIEFAYPHLAADIQARKSRGDYSSDIVEDLLVASPQVSVGEMTPIQSQMNQAIYSQRADKEGYGTQIMRGFRKGALGTLIPGGSSQSEIEMEEAFAPKSNAKSFVEGTAELASDALLLAGAATVAAPTGPIGASAAAMGASQSLKEIRKAFRTYQESGGPKDWSEFLGDVTQSAKNIGVEAAIGGALGALGPLVKATGLVGKAAKAAAVAGEGAVLTGAHVAKTGELPTPGEALVVIAQIATLKGAHKIAGLLKSDGGRAVVKKAFAELTPEQQQALMSGDINSSRFDQVLKLYEDNVAKEAALIEEKGEKEYAESKKEKESTKLKIKELEETKNKKISELKELKKKGSASEVKEKAKEINEINKDLKKLSKESQKIKPESIKKQYKSESEKLLKKAIKKIDKAKESNLFEYTDKDIGLTSEESASVKKILKTPLPEALRQLPIEEIAKMHVEIAAEKKSPIFTRVKEIVRNAREKLYRGIFDRTHQLKKLTQATKSDVDLQSMYYDSQRASALTEYRMKHGTFDPSTKESTGDIGLQEAIEKVAPEDYSNETLSLLLASRASIDRQNLGMQNPIPTDVAEAMQRKYATQYKGVLDEISNLNDEMLAIAKNAGILSEEGIAAMKELHEAYAPLERVFEEGELAVGQGESTTSPGYLKRAGDSLRKIVDPLVTTIKNYDLTVKQAERNRLATAIADEYMKLGYKAVEVPADSALANTVAKENRALAKNLRETESIYSPEAFTDGKETLYFYKGGKKYKIDNVDPSIAQLLRRPKSALGVLDGPIRWVKSKVSKANFTLSVIGMPVIQAKDMIVNAVSQKSLLGSWQYLASLPQSIFESVKKSSPIWHDYMKSGLYTHDYRALSSQDFASIAMDVFDAKKSQNKSIASRAINTLTAPYRALEYIDRTLSNAQKLTSLKLELKNPEYNGLPKEQRIAKAKAAVEKRTLNFQRSGSFALIRALNSAIPVFNTSIQDVDTIARQIKNNPAFLTNIVANITIPSIMAYMNVRDDERYKRLPQYVKDENIIVRPWFGLWEDQKSDLWLIPKPWLVGYVGTTMPVRFMQYIDSEKGEETLFEVAEELLEKFGEEINPFSFIYGKRSPIPRGMARIAAAEQYTPSTPEIAKAASRALGGYFSPIAIDVTAQMLLGGIYKDLAPIVDELVYASEVPAYTQQDLAEFGAKFLKRFHTRGADLRSSYLNKFYDLAAEEDAKLATIKLAEIRGETKKAEELRDKGYYKTANARKAISRIFKQAFEIQNASPKRYSRSKKDQLLRELAQDMDEFAKRYVEAIQESRKFHKETT